MSFYAETFKKLQPDFDPRHDAQDRERLKSDQDVHARELVARLDSHEDRMALTHDPSE